ncbi:phospho-acceptor domain-containing protein [Algoriphagus aquaeductus]|uniref:histidine kinase n=1 Tax=Algoriphagus aquaeductus TaxID=475299 RepID=A0A326RZ76_9BACT|nr:ATP-binding protein [Algoriphagus aquaeductus]PZV86328.1 phospho-acceptor domain-containing protein [Algoriphagus aquaeductus]
MTFGNRSVFGTLGFLFSLGFLLLIPKISEGQSVFDEIGRLPTTIFSPEEMGSFSSTFWTAIQGDEGLMYLGSGGELLEYDGVTWRTVIQNPIRILAKDPTGRIYYGGRDFGYLEVDSNGETQAISLLNLIPEELQENFQIWTIHFLNNSIFIQTNFHVIRLELEKNFSLKSLKSWPAEKSFTLAFLMGEDYYVSQKEKGLYQLIGEEMKLVPGTEILSQDQISIMLPFIENKREEFLIGMFNTGFYLLREDGLKRFPTQVDGLVQKGSQLYRASVYNGNYVLSVIDGGVIIMNPQGEILKKIDSSQGLPSDFITSTYQDLGGGLWVTTDDGIARVAINSPVQTFGKEHGINSTVRSIQKKGNDFFLGTNNGLVKFDSVSKSFKTHSNFNTGQIFDLKYDGENLLIAANTAKLLQKGSPVLLDFPENSGIAYSFLIPKKSPNLLYVGTGTGLLLYRRSLTKEPTWEYEGKVPGIGSVGGYLTEDKEGNVFVTSLNGVFRIDPSKTDFAHGELDKSIIKVQEIDINGSWSLINGDFYSSSKEGWKKYSNKEGEFVPAEEFQLLQGEMIDLTQHQSGIIWMESKNGKKYILKRQEDGTYAKDETPNSIAPYLSYVDFIDEDSIMWFGNPKGLIRYDPKKDNQTDKQFFTLIRRIETKTDTIPLPFYGRKQDVPAVERKENSYRFEFAAPYFEDEKKTKYQTYLEGFDSDWVDWNDNPFKEYTNLSPGTYTFHVRALAHTGRISEEAVYSFVVLAPWYATWWAYLIYALLIGAAITGIVKWRSRKLKAENRLLEERVAERTTELEKSIADLKATQAQLIQSEKMASLGELTAGIAHEIQNPLNFVNNFSELSVELIDEMNEEIEKGDLEEVKALASDIKENLNKIYHHGKRAGSIVRGMLAHSRKSSTEKEETDINALADECLRLSFHGLRAKDKSFTADFKTDFDANLPKINVVSQDLGRVILNMINNAFYAVREKSTLRKAQGDSEFKPEVIVQTRQENQKITISIQDNGQGIPESIKDKILQPFFTTKPAGEGTGLGLSLSYDIILAHGGELMIESEVGKGTKFTIILPY